MQKNKVVSRPGLLLSLAAGLVISFVLSLLPTQEVFAADAHWLGGRTVEYNGKQYEYTENSRNYGPSFIVLFHDGQACGVNDPGTEHADALRFVGNQLELIHDDTQAEWLSNVCPLSSDTNSRSISITPLSGSAGDTDPNQDADCLWENKSTIVCLSWGNVGSGQWKYVDSNPNDNRYHFRLQNGPNPQSCTNKSLLATGSNPYNNGQPKRHTFNNDEFVWTSTGPRGEGPKSCERRSGAVTVTTKGAADDPTAEDGAGGDTAPQCDGGPFGWVICPAIDTMQEATQYLAGQLDGVLRIAPLTTDLNNPIYQAWRNVLNVANILFAVAFLVIIFSQATSYGLSNYGVKRMLPRLLAAAILINVSYWLCAIAVDISNIVGASVTGLILSLDNINGGSIGEKVSNSVGAFDVIGLTLVTVIVLFFFLIPVLIAVLAVFFTIAARNAIIILLIMLAPLAFAAWLLPNTEKYFKKWSDLFVNMLALYPMIMGLFAGAVVASNIIASQPGFFNGVLGLIIIIMPLFALPFLFKTAGSVLARINDATKGMAMKAGGDKLHRAQRSAVGGFAKEKGMRMRAWASDRFSSSGVERDENGNVIGVDKRARHRLGRGLGYLASGQRKANKEKSIANSEARMKATRDERSTMGTDDKDKQILGANKADDLGTEGFVSESRSEEARRVGSRHKAEALSKGEQGAEFKDPMGQKRGLAVQAAGIGGIDAASRIRQQARAQLAEEQSEEEKQRAAARESISKAMGGDMELLPAWVHSGGDVNHEAFKRLPEGSQQRFRKLVAEGMHERGESFDAAIRDMANTGRGSPELAAKAMQLAKDRGGYTAQELGGMTESLQSTYRKTGRGDMIIGAEGGFKPGELEAAARMSKEFTDAKAAAEKAGKPFDEKAVLASIAPAAASARGGFGVDWGKVAARDISRHAFTVKNADGTTAPPDAAIESLSQEIQNNPEYAREVVKDIDSMEPRAREHVVKAVEKAYVDTGKTRPDGTTRYESGVVVQQLREDLKLTPGVTIAQPPQQPPGGGGTPAGGAPGGGAPGGGAPGGEARFAAPANVQAERAATARYTAPYSSQDLQSMGPGGMQMIVQSAGGVQNLSRRDIEKIADAVADHPSFRDTQNTQVRQFHDQLREQLGSENNENK